MNRQRIRLAFDVAAAFCLVAAEMVNAEHPAPDAGEDAT